jgi:APA family basic amino acid/polyamine antiporter
LAVLLLIAGYLHQVTVGFDADYTLLIIAIVFAIFHLGLYLTNINKHKLEPENP